MNTETNFMSFEDLTKLIEEHKKETHPYKKYEFDSTSYTLLLISINNLIKENKKLNGAIQTYDILLKSNIEENKQLKDNQVRAMNKIRDFIDNANCEIKESKYSNDKHGLYWELFRKDLTNIQKLIKGINTDEYVNIPKYREKELLNLEDNWNKLIARVINRFNRSQDVQFLDVLQDMQELEQGSDSNVKD